MLVPNADAFVAMTVRQEAVLSSRIEGTLSSLDDVLIHDLDPGDRRVPIDITEVTNYARALRYGLRRLDDLPLSLRLLRELHAVLLENTGSEAKRPGEFRTTQNWIGAPGATLATAHYIPPPAHEMHDALADLERFLHDTAGLPPLVHAAIAHSQFEMIHPFLDGNGRVGRLLITLLLHHHRVLSRPLLYLSQFFDEHRMEYYRWLSAVHQHGDWEGWIAFFLAGVEQTATAAASTARAVVELRAEHVANLQRERLGANALRLLDLLFHQPLVDAAIVRDRLAITSPTANALLARFVKLGLLEEITGMRRNRRYRYRDYVSLFQQPATRW